MATSNPGRDIFDHIHLLALYHNCGNNSTGRPYFSLIRETFYMLTHTVYWVDHVVTSVHIETDKRRIVKFILFHSVSNDGSLFKFYTCSISLYKIYKPQMYCILYTHYTTTIYNSTNHCIIFDREIMYYTWCTVVTEMIKRHLDRPELLSVAILSM